MIGPDIPVGKGAEGVFENPQYPVVPAFWKRLVQTLIRVL